MKKSTVCFYSFAAAFGALVVGLNMGGMSGAIGIIEKEFGLTAMSKGFVTSSLMAGCLFGALFGGRMSDRYGRRPMLLASAVFLALSAAGSAFWSASWIPLSVFRLIGGFGAGILSAVIPVYITEISPASLRGTLVSLYQLFVVVGILVAYCANYWFSGLPDNWHFMLGIPLAFIIVEVCLLLPLPESPRWVAQKTGAVSSDERKENKLPVSELFKGRTRRVVFMGVMLAFFQQITGINVVVNYAPDILSRAGIAGSDPLLQTVFVGAANLLFTVVAIWLVDKAGRKTLLISGSFGCALSLAYLSYAYSAESSDSIGILIAILAYIGFFALSLSPLMFVVTSEIYPSRIRGTATALSTGISWLCAFAVVQFYPLMEKTLGTAVSFGIFCALCLAAGIYIWIFIPETKGKDLEQIELELKLR